MTPGRLGYRRIGVRTAALLPAVLVFTMHAVAGVVPPEPLHLGGIQDGADYDSLIQPQVFSLWGTPVAAVVLATPFRTALEAARPPASNTTTAGAARSPRPRAPPPR